MGAAAGSLVGGGFADALGRRASFMLCALPMLVGPLLSATAVSLNPMVAGRFLSGVAIGLSSALVPLYISEVGRAVLALGVFGFERDVDSEAVSACLEGTRTTFVSARPLCHCFRGCPAFTHCPRRDRAGAKRTPPKRQPDRSPPPRSAARWGPSTS
jgi:hypothetical protein